MGNEALEETVLTRDRLALVLDSGDLGSALALVDEVGEYFGVAKVGLELFTAVGPRAVTELRARGQAVFLDLKFHDIPNTVRGAARSAAALGVAYLNLHCAGGLDMVRAGVAGAAEGAETAGVERPMVLGVTVLTSDADARAFEDRLGVAVDAGCDGVVCSAHEVARVGERVPEFLTVVPGIRLAGSSTDDQARVMTPGAAFDQGADLLVVGRTVTAAANPRAAARAVFEEVASRRG